MARRTRLALLPLALGICVVFAVAGLHVLRASPLVELEERVFDQFQRLAPRDFDPDRPVVVVDIDEASIADLGQWPWPRTYVAELIARLSVAGAAAVGFDVIFSEPDRTSPLRLREAYARFADGYATPPPPPLAEGETPPDHDEILAQLMAQTPTVLATVLTPAPGPLRPQIKAGISFLGSDPMGLVTHYNGALVNLPVLEAAAQGVGSISLTPSEGEIVRRVPMISTVGETRVPALSAEMLRVAQGAGSLIVQSTDAQGGPQVSGAVAIASMRLGAAVVPLDADGALRVRYSGAEAERVISARAILAGDDLDPALAERIAGRLVLVGASASSLFDIKRTPLTARIPGVHIHAEILEQVLAGDYLTRPDWGYGWELLVLAVLGLVTATVVALGWPVVGMVVTLGSLAGLGGLSWLAFAREELLVSPVAPGLAVGGTYLAVSVMNWVRSEAGRREVTRQFQHFVSPEVIEDILADPDRHLTPGGAQRELSILFLDVRRFSTITETMPPDEVILFINSLLTPLSDVVLEHEGTIDKYMGDALMAFWNAPRVTEHHQEKAVAAMLAFFPALEKVNADLARRGIVAAEIGVGINTGLCSVGNMGSTRRLAYSCVGDAVNLAARLEGLTKQYGVATLIGEATAAAVAGWAVIEIDQVAVKGRSRPERVATVAGDAGLAADPRFRAVAAALAEARAAYLARDWDAALAAYARAAAVGKVGLLDPAKLADAFAERIADLRADPPGPDWDGVHIARSK